MYNADRISEKLQLTPAKTWMKDESQKKPLYRDYSFWAYDSEEQFDAASDQLFDAFLEPLRERKELIIQLLEEENLECDFDIVVNINAGNSSPACIITAEQAALLAAFKCGVEFDMYDNRKLAGEGDK